MRGNRGCVLIEKNDLGVKGGVKRVLRRGFEKRGIRGVLGLGD